MTAPFRLTRVNCGVNINLLLLLATACSLCTVSSAFSVVRQTCISPRALTSFGSRAGGLLGPAAAMHPTTSLFSSQDDDSDASATTSRPKRRVRRRKESDGNDDTGSSSAPEAAAPVANLRPREAAKPMQVRDIRDLVPGGRASSVPTPPEQAETSTTSDFSSSSSSSSQAAPTKSMYVSAGAGSNSENTGNLDDSLKMLLLDARKMQDDQDTERQDAIESGTFDATADTSMKKKVRSAIGTIIAADFFVVCGFLLWFLVGIAARSVADNDTIQIAFNNNFQLLVQPAIGILMVGSVAGAIFPEKEEEY